DPEARRVRAREPRPHRGEVARRGLHRRGRAHRRRASRCVHPLRHAPRGRRACARVPRSRDGSAAPAAGGPGGSTRPGDPRGGVALHIGTNVTNEFYDGREGVDTIVSPRASHAIVKGRITDRAAYRFAIAAFLVATLVGLYLVSVRGWPIVALGIVGLVGGYTYTAPPFQYKFGPVGIPLVFLLMGPLMVVGSYYAVSGRFDL